MAEKKKIGILGASGYTGAELVRLLLRHPRAEIALLTAIGRAGQMMGDVFPQFAPYDLPRLVTIDEVDWAKSGLDLVFCALPHATTQKVLKEVLARAPAERIIDLSADFRLTDLAAYQRWYGEAHGAPAWMDRFIYGLPEVSRERLRGARYASGVGCNATASILALLPLARAGVIDPARPVVVDLKVGSSEGGNKANLASHHPERSGAMRSFAPTGRRPSAEVEQALGLSNVHLSITSVEAVRGVLATAHVWTRPGISDKELWGLYRQAYRAEPFVRLVKDKGSIYRYPEPKLLAGTNWADVGFEADTDTGRVVSLAAIDNLGKGAAAQALQNANLMTGQPETAGLEGLPTWI